MRSRIHTCGAYLDSGTPEDDAYVKHIPAEEKRRERGEVACRKKVRKRIDLLNCECLNLILADTECTGAGVDSIMSSRVPLG
ncbi:MAG: hypothetical protein GX422_08285 [Deltaproteobacteria bacterium]|nr:hypothetical protein [Deltaproteobacteria bacterium]